MRSSKWLVFIRSLLAGFDRSLTVSTSRYFRKATLVESISTALVSQLGTLTMLVNAKGNWPWLPTHVLVLSNGQ